MENVNQSSVPVEKSSQKNVWVWIALVVLVLGGLGVRFIDLTDEPLDFHPVRQLRSAMIARGLYFQNRDDVPAWQQEMAMRQATGLEKLEPELLEHLVAFSYRVVGSEILWVARIYSILFWTAGGAGLYFLGKRLAGDGALISVAYFLFLPFSVQASRSFQPDPLMVALTIFTLLALDMWFEEETPSWRLTLAAGVLGGLAVLVKPPAAFYIAGAGLALVFYSGRLPALLRSGKAWAMVALWVLPSAAYYMNGIVIAKNLTSESWRFFVVSLLTSPRFYLDWLAFVQYIVGYGALMLALSALVLFAGRARALMVGLLAAYLANGIVFTYHIATHDYYSLPLLMVVALGLGAPGGILLERVKKMVTSRPVAQLLAAAIACFAILLPVRTARGILVGHDYRPEVGYWEQLGDVLEHRSDVLEISHDYGYRLEYYGYVEGSAWPTTQDLALRTTLGQSGEEDSQMIIADQLEGRSLFVVTILGELERLPVLARYLAERPVFAQGEDYIVYDLR